MGHGKSVSPLPISHLPFAIRPGFSAACYIDLVTSSRETAPQATHEANEDHDDHEEKHEETLKGFFEISLRELRPFVSFVKSPEARDSGNCSSFYTSDNVELKSL